MERNFVCSPPPFKCLYDYPIAFAAHDFQYATVLRVLDFDYLLQ